MTCKHGKNLCRPCELNDLVGDPPTMKQLAYLARLNGPRTWDQPATKQEAHDEITRILSTRKHLGRRRFKATAAISRR